jgi:small-conductance mechanosensitive channel
VVAAVDGVVAVENQLTLAADFGARLHETWVLLKDRAARAVAAIPLLITAIVVVMVMRWLGGWLARHLHIVRLDSRNPFLGTVIRRSVRAAFLIIGVLIALDLLGATALVTAVLGSAGVVGIVLGFAFRDMAENYLSGILLSLRRPFEPGDHVRVDSHEGRVVSLSTRNTVLMTMDGNELRLPNATVFKAVLLNFTHNPRRRFSFTLGVSYGEDLQRAQDLGVATLAAMQGVLDDPAPSATVDLVGDSSVTISYYAWVNQRETGFFKARSEAIRLNRRVILCSSSDGATCSSDAGRWNGWIVFADNNRNDSPDSGEVLRVGTISPTDVVVQGSQRIVDQGNRIRMGADGLVRAASGSSAVLLQAKLSVCIATTSVPQNTREIRIGAGGQGLIVPVNNDGTCPVPSNA